MFSVFKSELRETQTVGRSATEITTPNDSGGNITRRHFFFNLFPISCQIE